VEQIQIEGEQVIFREPREGLDTPMVRACVQGAKAVLGMLKQW
jgi:hypothetical protein